MFASDQRLCRCASLPKEATLTLLKNLVKSSKRANCGRPIYAKLGCSTRDIERDTECIRQSDSRRALSLGGMRGGWLTWPGVTLRHLSLRFAVLGSRTKGLLDPEPRSLFLVAISRSDVALALGRDR